MTRRRPNLLFVMTDQQRADSVGYAGASPSDTPVIDALASKGVAFVNAYSPASTCVPARGSLLTGALHHRLPVVSHMQALAPGAWTLARALRAEGYETALFGKMHFAPIDADHGFETTRSCEHLRAGYEPGAIDDYARFLESKGLRDERGVQPGHPRAFPYAAEYHPTNWTTDHAIDFLSKRDKSKPYFAVVSYAHPHTPYDPPEPYASLYDPAEQALPSSDLSVNEGLPRPFGTALLRTPGVGVFPNARVDAPSGAKARRVIAAIRGLIKQIDDALGRLLAHVDLEDTFVWFTSDHGDYGGHRGLLGKVPWIPFDDLAKVPTFCAGFGVKGGRRITAPMQSFDFVPTALELAGARLPGFGLDAKSLVPTLAGAPADEGRDVFCGTSQSWPAIRRGGMKLIGHRRSKAFLLYDVARDPEERVNLSARPEHADFVQYARERLASVMNEPKIELLRSQPVRSG